MAIPAASKYNRLPALETAVAAISASGTPPAAALKAAFKEAFDG